MQSYSERWCEVQTVMTTVMDGARPDSTYFKSRRRVEIERARFTAVYKALCAASGSSALIALIFIDESLMPRSPSS